MDAQARPEAQATPRADRRRPPALRRGTPGDPHGDERIEVVGQASDGGEAVELARKLGPDVVLMDVSMPVLDGFEATREIRAASEGVRVLMLTGSNSRADVDRSREAGASGYITKDRIASELVASIVEVTRRRLP